MEKKDKCYICNKEITKKGSLRHIKSCMKNIKGETEVDLIQILGGEQFYIYVLVPVNFTLNELDFFLREIWLECCGHLSRFEDPKKIKSNIFSYNFDDAGKEDIKFMNKKISSFNKDSILNYEYDFGTTSYVKIKIIDKFKINKKIKDFSVISYNQKPFMECCKCREESIIVINDWNKDEWNHFCKKHYNELDENKIEEFPQFNLVNSPRVGYCSDVPDADLELKKYLWS